MASSFTWGFSSVPPAQLAPSSRAKSCSVLLRAKTKISVPGKRCLAIFNTRWAEAPKPVNQQTNISEKLINFGKGELRSGILQKPGFAKLATEHFNKEIEDSIKTNKLRAEIKDKEPMTDQEIIDLRTELRSVYFNEDGDPSFNLMDTLAGEIERLNQPFGRVDTWETKNKIRIRVRCNKS